MPIKELNIVPNLKGVLYIDRGTGNILSSKLILYD